MNLEANTFPLETVLSFTASALQIRFTHLYIFTVRTVPPRCSGLGCVGQLCLSQSCPACPRPGPVSGIGIGPGEALADSRSWMRREAAGTSAALQSPAEPIAAARGGAGAQPSIAQRLPSTVGLGCWKSWWARGEPCSQPQRAPSPAASLEQPRWPRRSAQPRHKVPTRPCVRLVARIC